MALRLTNQEAVMGQVIPRQHPAVVLRSQYKAVLAMLCVALVAIVALAATLVIVANDDQTTVSAQPNAHQQQILPPGTRFDGGPDEGTRGIQAAPPAEVAPGTRFDGGPDEGTRGIQVAPAEPLAPGTRFDGGPDEGTRGPTSYWETSDPRSSYQPVPDQGFKARAGGPSMLPTGPSEEQQPQQHPGTQP
jgi:hypothetical protein